MGNTARNSVSLINEYCSEPTRYKTWLLREAADDAKIHYDNGEVSELWYKQVIKTLSEYI